MKKNMTSGFCLHTLLNTLYFTQPNKPECLAFWCKLTLTFQLKQFEATLSLMINVKHFYLLLFKKGIKHVSDLLDIDGNMYQFDVLRKHMVLMILFLDYLS